MSFGKNLRNARINKGMSQKELAERVGVFPSVISRYENSNRSPHADNIHKFAKALDISPAELILEVTK